MMERVGPDACTALSLLPSQSPITSALLLILIPSLPSQEAWAREGDRSQYFSESATQGRQSIPTAFLRPSKRNWKLVVFPPSPAMLMLPRHAACLSCLHRTTSQLRSTIRYLKPCPSAHTAGAPNQSPIALIESTNRRTAIETTKQARRQKEKS